MLVIDLHALEAIDLLHFVDQMLLEILWSADLKDLVRHNRTLGKLLTLFHKVAFEDNDVFGEQDQVFFLGSSIGIL